MRVVKSSNEFFDILDKIGNGKYVTIGYVVGSNLVGVPTVKRRNPLTNRMKGYPDHAAFGSEEEISALVKISSYNMRYTNREAVSKRYGEWKNAANAIRTKFGAPPIGDKQSYKGVNTYGQHGIETYRGANQDLQGHSYNPQNIYGVKPKSVVYAINQDGHIMKELTPEQVKPYLKKYKERHPDAPSYRDSGANALAQMGAEEEQIKDYLSQIDELKFSYINFEANSILWIAASVDGEKIVYINDNLQRAVDGINIKPEDFRAIARERYKIDLASLTENRTRRRGLIRITESDIHRMVNESVHRLLKEISKDTVGSARDGARKKYHKMKNDPKYSEDEKVNALKQYWFFDNEYSNRRNMKKDPHGFTRQTDSTHKAKFDKHERERREGKRKYKDGRWVTEENRYRYW